MTRAEILEAASIKLNQAALLLAAVGEDRLAADAEELADWVDFSQVPSAGETPSDPASH